MTSEEFYNRLLNFAKKCLNIVKILPNTVYKEYSEQLIRSSASPAANYIEALEASSRKDFIHRLKICRKEAKESIHWLDLIQSANSNSTQISKGTQECTREAKEFIRILRLRFLYPKKTRK